MAELILLSQHDPRWKDIKVGTSNSTIGQIGCTITCIAMKYGLTPDKVNELLNNAGGYAQTNLVNWTKLPQALPGTEFVYKYSNYENEIVKQNLPCLVEVDATPIGGTRHWILYVGNGILYDPWDGQAKSTDTYTPLSFVVLKGIYNESTQQVVKQTVNTGTNTITLNSHGIDINNEASVQVVFDTWFDVANGKYVTKAEYDAVLSQKEVIEDPNYTALKALGYTSVDDVTKELKKRDDAIVPLKTENAQLLKRVDVLAGEIQATAKEDHTTAELGDQALNENKQLKDQLNEIMKAAGADKPTSNSIVSFILQGKELADRYIKILEAQDKKRKQEQLANQETKVVTSSEPSGFSLLLNLLNITPNSKEVK